MMDPSGSWLAYMRDDILDSRTNLQLPIWNGNRPLRVLQGYGTSDSASAVKRRFN